jgi:hypothetical protein
MQLVIASVGIFAGFIPSTIVVRCDGTMGDYPSAPEIE